MGHLRKIRAILDRNWGHVSPTGIPQSSVFDVKEKLMLIIRFHQEFIFEKTRCIIMYLLNISILSLMNMYFNVSKLVFNIMYFSFRETTLQFFSRDFTRSSDILLSSYLLFCFLSYLLFCLLGRWREI